MQAAEKTNTGEGAKGKKVRTTSDDAVGKSVSEKSKSTGGKCVGENSTGGKPGATRSDPNPFESSSEGCVSHTNTLEVLLHLYHLIPS